MPPLLDGMTPIPVTHLLWVDLEASGLYEHVDEIVELGAIVTTSRLEVLEEYQAVIPPSDSGRQRIEDSPFVKQMHEANGLLRELDERRRRLGPPVTTEDYAKRVRHVESEMMELLTRNGVAPGAAALCGSGIAHIDRPFLKVRMPGLVAALTYWMVDVGHLRRAYNLWGDGSDLSDVNESKTHRAIDDIRCHLAEARAFQELFAGHSGQPR